MPKGIKIIRRELRKLYDRLTFNSKSYWERRYRTGGNSGAGSYSLIAEFLS